MQAVVGGMQGAAAVRPLSCMRAAFTHLHRPPKCVDRHSQSVQLGCSRRRGCWRLVGPLVRPGPRAQANSCERGCRLGQLGAPSWASSACQPALELFASNGSEIRERTGVGKVWGEPKARGRRRCRHSRQHPARAPGQPHAPAPPLVCSHAVVAASDRDRGAVSPEIWHLAYSDPGPRAWWCTWLPLPPPSASFVPRLREQLVFYSSSWRAPWLPSPLWPCAPRSPA